MILYLDTETTGLTPGSICQISYIMQTEKSVVGKNMYFSVENIEQSAMAVHGLTPQKLKVLSNGQTFADRVEEISKDLESASLIVAHNTSFDFMFIRKELERCGKVFTHNESFCSMKCFTPVCKLKKTSGKGYKYPRLSELCTFLRITDLETELEAKKLFGDSSFYHDSRFDTTAVYLAINKAFNMQEFSFVKGYL